MYLFINNGFNIVCSLYVFVIVYIAMFILALIAAQIFDMMSKMRDEIPMQEPLLTV